jgi:outer membrane protein assembly factor BamB
MVIYMRERMNMKPMSVLILVALAALEGCLIQEDPFRPIISDNLEQCVTPLHACSSFDVRPDGISMTSDGSLIAVLHTMEGLYLFNHTGDVIWSSDRFGGRLPKITEDGSYLITQIRRHTTEDPFFLTKVDHYGNIIWKREIGLIGDDGLAVTPDGSFIAVGATDKEKKGHLMLFDQDGNTLWDHQIDGRIETVKVSKSGYVVAGPRDTYVYVYDYTGELIFKSFTGSWYDPQNVEIAPDESFFLFVSEHKYLNCYTLEGERVWQKEVGDLSNITLSADGEYIVAAEYGTLLLFDKKGNEVWSKKVSDTYIDRIAVSSHCEYIAINTEEVSLFPVSAFEVYNKKGELLWRYEEEHPFKAIALGGDGHYLVAGSGFLLLLFDNFQAIEEYAESECAQPDTSLMIC